MKFHLMKRSLLLVAGLALAASHLPAQNSISLETPRDRASYSIGISIGNNLKAQGAELNAEAVAAGIKAAVSGEKPLLSEEEMTEALVAFQKQMMAQHEQQGEKNLKEGEAFLEANKKKKDVQTTASGLQYRVITEGKGERPKETDTVTTHYRGKLLDGTEFDSSYERKEPASFPLQGIIEGWREALQLMPVGSKWELFIPAELAYGEAGRPPVIPPNSTLVFEIELLNIN
jgi:FKBP-type peptidyl-prolyl cis-trans isomerase FklB